MWLANFLGGGTILFLGLIIRLFKASNLLAGYNTASKEERAKYDEEKLTSFMGNLLMTSSIILIIGGFLSAFTNIPEYLIAISWVLFLIIIIGSVVYMNTGNRFKK
jgi:Ca2+-dependent lipid-binding protein